MTTIPLMIEIGPKGKRTVATAPDWPGLERGAKSEDEAIDRLRAYFPRYAPIAERAGIPFDTAAEPETILRYPGTGSTDFWGISFGQSDIDRQPWADGELDRHIALMQACWAFFDDTWHRVSPELRKGPRGGGRDRDQIVAHTFGTEREWAGGIGVHTPPGVMLTDEGRRTHREAYAAAIRAFAAEGKQAKKWTLRYLIRHTAYHSMDHAWEMEDKDLTNA
jgi:hypothetical protein